MFTILVFLHTSKKACVYSKCRLESNGALKHVLGCCTFDYVTSVITMKQIHLKLYALVWGKLILVPIAKGLVKYYVKPDELFCVALKVCAGHHLFGKLGLSFLKI